MVAEQRSADSTLRSVCCSALVWGEHFANSSWQGNLRMRHAVSLAIAPMT